MSEEISSPVYSDKANAIMKELNKGITAEEDGLHFEKQFWEASAIPGHPAYIFRLENKEIQKLIDIINADIQQVKTDSSKKNIKAVQKGLKKLLEIDRHYLRKETILIPMLERDGIISADNEMCLVQNGICTDIKDAISVIDSNDAINEALSIKIEEILKRVNEVVLSEEKLLLPMAVNSLTEDEWLKINRESVGIGYSLIKSREKWKPVKIDVEEKMIEMGGEPSNDGFVHFDAGILCPEEINAIFNTLPMDLTFIDKDGIVQYFSKSKEKIFPQTKAFIGRQLISFHTPASLRKVNQIMDDFKNGKKDNEDFWVISGSKYVLIRYYAVRNRKGKYLGALETIQNIKPLQEIQGEKQLMH